MRPRSVALAEVIYFASIVLVVIGAAVTWAIASAAYGVGFAIGTIAFAVVLPLVLLLLATRRRSRVALWLLVAWTAFGVWSVGLQLVRGSPVGLIGALTILQIVLMLISVAMLFTPTARAWFAGADLPEEVEA